MNAIGIVENLIKAGTLLKSAWSTARRQDPSLEWPKFITSTEFDGAFKQVATILDGMTETAVSAALEEVRTKQAALLGDKSVVELSSDKLAQYDALLDVENQLTHQFALQAQRTTQWVNWLIDDALPVLMRVAKIVLPVPPSA